MKPGDLAHEPVCSCPEDAAGPWDCLDCPAHGKLARDDMEAEARAEQWAEGAWLRAAENAGYDDPGWDG